MKLQGRVLLPILLLIVLLMGISGALSYMTAKESLTESLIDNMEGEAVGLKRSLTSLMEDARHDVERTTIRTDVVNFFKGNIYDKDAQLFLSRSLKNVADTYPDFDRMTIYDLNGITVACSDPKVLGNSFADRDYFQQTKATQKSYISAPFRSRVTNSSVIVAATPVMLEGKMVGVLTGNLNLRQFFAECVEPVEVGSEGYAFVLTADGMVVIHKNTDWELNKDLPESAEYRRLAQKGQGFDSFTDASGKTVLVYVEKDPGSGMVAAIRADEDDVFSSLTKIRNQTLMVTGIGILIGLAVIFIIIKPVANAVRQGAEFAGEIARGNLNSTLKVKRGDEIGALANALRAIPEVLKEIISVYSQLEKDVEQGHMATQGDASRFSGEYAGLINGTNSVMSRYRMVLDNIPSPVVILSDEGKATYLNTKAQEVAGRDYLGKTCGQLFARKDYQTEQCALRRSMETGQPASGETVAYPQGKEMEVAYSSIPLKNAEGKISAVLQLITDLTEIKAAQKTMTEVANHAMDISNRVAAASEELSAQVEQVSRGADQQRDRAHSTATAMEEMNATVLEVARSAGDASHQTESTRSKAFSGAELVEKVIKAINEVNVVSTELQENMQNLGNQAESIGGVMNVISDIADQTNLLALNAAIEAARAGEAGRGFAVVADEVRKLAEKTMSATTEVGANIQGIQVATQANTRRVTDAAASVGEATELAANSGDALREILELANKSSELVAGIATAVEEQSATAEEINRSVDEINRIAGETASGMAQSTTAIQEIAAMSQELKDLLGRLR